MTSLKARLVAANTLALMLAALPDGRAATQGIRLYDTGTSALSAETVSTRAGWTEVGAGKVGRAFAGAACVSNGPLFLILRREGKGPVCYSQVGTRVNEGPTLVAEGLEGGEAQAIAAFRVIKNSPEEVVVEADAIAGPHGTITARYLMKPGQPIVEIQPGQGMEGVRVQAPGRYAVLPDVFAGDLVIAPGETAAPSLRFPSEDRMLLELVEGGNAIVECTWPSSGQRVRLLQKDHAFVASEISCSKTKGDMVAVAVLAAPAIWHEQSMAELDPVKDLKLEWHVPFPALWRADFRRTDGLIDSWKCVIRHADGTFERFDVTNNLNKARTVWTTARASFAYPACIEGDACFLRKTQFDAAPEIKYDDRGEVLIYPYRAFGGGPAGAVDAWCDALAGTPRESLDAELQIGSFPRDKWPATCDVTANYEDIFDSGEEKAQKAYVLKRLDAMDHFVVGIRSRMNEYLDWARKTRSFCAQTKAEQPRLAPLVDELDGYLEKFDEIYRSRKLEERNPAAVRALSNQVVALIDSREEKKSEQAKELGRDTRTIGGNQDDSIGEFRMLTKELRQRAGYCMAKATDDASFEFARALRQRTMEMLQGAFVHEFATTD